MAGNADQQTSALCGALSAQKQLVSGAAVRPLVDGSRLHRTIQRVRVFETGGGRAAAATGHESEERNGRES
jgi:hypothetical protein